MTVEPTELLERIARAIDNAAGTHSDDVSCWLDHAKAALEAMSAPVSDNVIDNRLKAEQERFDAYAACASNLIRAAEAGWRAAEAALADEKAKREVAETERDASDLLVQSLLSDASAGAIERDRLASELAAVKAERDAARTIRLAFREPTCSCYAPLIICNHLGCRCTECGLPEAIRARTGETT